MRILCPLMVPLALFACACSSSSSPAGPPPGQGDGDAASGGDDAAPDGYIGCTGQWDTYSAYMTKQGQALDGGVGTYTYTLTQASPAPPALHTNAWTMKIADATGASPAASQVTAYPYMPQMRHGSSVTPGVVSNADGTFAVSNLVLFMPGIWTVTMTTTTTVPSGADAGADDAAAGPSDGGGSDAGEAGDAGAAADGGTMTGTPSSVPIDKAVFTFCISN